MKLKKKAAQNMNQSKLKYYMKLWNLVNKYKNRKVY